MDEATLERRLHLNMTLMVTDILTACALYLLILGKITAEMAIVFGLVQELRLELLEEKK